MDNDQATRETHNGREFSVSGPGPVAESYPGNDRYQWQEFPGLAIELGGYSDITAIDPYTGRRFWLGHAFTCDQHAEALRAATPGDAAMAVYNDKRGCPDCSSSTLISAIRRLLDAIEAVGFLSEPETSGDGPNRATT